MIIANPISMASTAINPIVATTIKAHSTSVSSITFSIVDN